MDAPWAAVPLPVRGQCTVSQRLREGARGRERARSVLGLLGVLNSSANFPSEFAVVVVVVCEMRVTIGKIKCIINCMREKIRERFWSGI